MTSCPTPIIGFSLDYETVQTYSKLPWYALRENYCAAVSTLGAAPLCLPHEPLFVNTYLDLLSGLIITGGAFDIPPSMYGDLSQHETVVLKEKRTEFEFAITRGAIARGIPILGICGGQQLLNVVLGGTLIQHIPDSVDNALAHEQPGPRHEIGHSIIVKENTLLHQILGSTEAHVNSAHHQAIRSVGNGVIINAIAPDGVIEGIEYPPHPFCLGVQWHPEYHVTKADDSIFEALIIAAKNYQQQHNTLTL